MAYNLDTSHDSPNYTPESQSSAVFGYPRVIEGITIHWWGDPSQNPSFGGVRDYLCRPNGNTSAHYVATGTNRQVACIVAPNDVAWHSGNAQGNAKTIGIELDPRCRDEDYDVAAELVADIRSAFGDVPIYSHKMWFNTSCPGNYDIDRIDRESYTKQSNAEWGQVTDKNPKAPVNPTPVAGNATDDEIKAAYLEILERKADQGGIDHYKNYSLEFVRNDLRNSNEYKTLQANKAANQPSPTNTPPKDGGGKPVTEKPDYSEENNTLLKKLLALVQLILDKLTGVFK